MKRFFLTAGVCCTVLVGCKEKPAPEPTYRLVWADEFTYSGLPDSTRWTYEVGKIRNQEAQFYRAKQLANSRVENGNLLLMAQHDPSQANPITSASLMTKGIAEFLYGRIEMRAKMPTGNGAWTAIWTKGINQDAVGWPACGEIDIMEWLGFAPQYAFGSLHKPDAAGKDVPQISISPAVPDLSTEFHIYALEWDETELSMFIDDTKYAVYRASDMTPGEWEPFKKPHFLLLNLAMGGISGREIDYSKFPFIFTVDYVRYYKKG